jgi:glycosyltransferase involved in cell wall biosynthesis
VNIWVGPDAAIYHATDFTLPPVSAPTRTILTVHDLSFIHAPETAEPSLRAYLNAVVPRSVARADLILADSDSTRHDVIDAYGVPHDRIHTLYCGVEDTYQPIDDPLRLQAIRDKYAIGARPFILSVGTVQPRKNYARLAEALHQLGYEGVKLVIVGGKGWLEDELYQTVERLGMGQQVQFLGYVPDDDLPLLYNAARVFALPSLYEGFGLPPLEAMACGVPVVTSNVSSLPEVVGKAALLVDPYDIDAISDALDRALTDDSLRKTLITRGQIRAQSFSWQSAAQQLRQHYATLS